MKKIVILLTILSLILFSGCSQNNNVDKLESIKEKGVLTLAVSPDYPPYEFYVAENGEVKVTGADIYLAEEIAKKLNVKLEIVQLSFDSLLPALTSGRVDMVISGMNPTEERRKAVDFSDTYYVSGSIFVIRKDADELKSIEDIRTKKIAAQKGSIQEKGLAEDLQVPQSNIQSLTDVPNLLQDLKNKNVDAVFLAEDVAQIALSKEDSLKISDFELERDAESDGMAIAFKKGNNAKFIEEVNKVISEIKKDNKFEKQLEINAAKVS